MKTLLLLAIGAAAIQIAHGSEPIVVNTKTGVVQQTSSGVGSVSKPYDFRSINALGLGTALTAGNGINISSGVVTVDKTVITGQGPDTAPTMDDLILTYNTTGDVLKSVLLSDLAANLTINSIIDQITAFGVQPSFQTMTQNWSFNIPNANSTFVVPANRVAGQFPVSLGTNGAITFGFPDVSTGASFTADQNNYTPASLTYFLRLSSDGTRNLTGISQSQVAGTNHWIACVGNSIVLKHENAGSTASNRFHNSTGADITLASGQSAIMFYDATTSRWNVNAIGGVGSGTGTVTSVDTTSPVTGGPFTTSGTIALDVSQNFGFTQTQDITITTAQANNVSPGLTLTHNTSGTPANGLGAGIAFQAQSSTTANRAQGILATSWSDVTDATRTAFMDFQVVNSGTNATKMRLFGSGGLAVNGTTDPGAGVVSANTGFKIAGSEFPSTSNGIVKRTAANTYSAATDGTDYVSPSGAATETNKTFNSSTNSISDANTFTHDLTTVPNATGGWNKYFVTGSDFTTTNLTATPITGLTTGTLSNATWYEFEVVLRLLNAADSAGLKWGITGNGTGTASQVFCTYMVNSTGTAAAAAVALNGVATLSSAFISYSSGEGILAGKGFFLSRSTGTATMEIDIAKVTSNTATVRVGSRLWIRKADL